MFLQFGLVAALLPQVLAFGTVEVPLKVNIVLIGVEASADTLADFLHDGIFVGPSCVETGEEMYVSCSPSFQVKRASAQVASEVADAMTAANVGHPGVAKIEGSVFGEKVNSVIASLFGVGVLDDPGQLTIAFVDVPGVLFPGGHCLSYMGAGCSNAFSSAVRSVIVDLSAAPPTCADLAKGSSCTAADLAGMSPVSVPRMATFVHSALRTFGVPDAWFASIPTAEKILIPIIVFRDHNDFDPFGDDAAYRIDLDTVQEQVERILLPHQHATFVVGTHSLRDHPHIAIAYHNAIRHKVMRDVSVTGRVSFSDVSFLESRALVRELTASRDVLTASLIETSPLSKIFFNKHVPSGTAGGTTEGTHVLPVFVFANKDATGEPLLFDAASPVTTTQDMVLIRQSDHSASTYFSVDGVAAVANLRNPTRSIVAGLHRTAPSICATLSIAGLSSVIGGVVSPPKAWNQASNSVVLDNTWAVGHHPHGLLSNCTKLSLLHIHTAHQNFVLSNANNAWRKITGTMQSIEEFLAEHMYNPNRDSLNHSSNNEQSWLENLHHFGPKGAPLATATITHLHHEYGKLVTQFQRANNLIQEANWKQAIRHTKVFAIAAERFKVYSDSELQQAKNDMECCSVSHNWHHSSAKQIAGGVLLMTGVATMLATLT